MKPMATCSKTFRACSYSYRFLRCRCFECKDWKRIRARRDSIKAKERFRIWRVQNLARSRTNSLNYQRKHPEKVLNWKLKQYGITSKEYEWMYSYQNEVCAICLKSERNKMYSRLAVDHNHKTGVVRGLLCSHCNTAIGKMLDSPSLLRKAADYIEKGSFQ